MIYLAYQTHTDLMEPLRALARVGAAALNDPLVAFPGNGLMRNFAAAMEVFGSTVLTHHRPPFNIERVTVGGREVEVHEEAAQVTPFGTLLHFRKDIQIQQPRVLMVAPLSGHFATLLRGTVRTLLPDNDVYITDWHNARDVSLAHGQFGLDEYVDHLIGFLEAIGKEAHVVAVCQPCVAVLATVAVMAQTSNPAQPRSMTLMAGPIDTRINPTKVNELAISRPIDWFERNLIATVPARFPGAGRRVYPGFVQLTAFMSMNLERHVKAHFDLYDQLANGDREKADGVLFADREHHFSGTRAAARQAGVAQWTGGTRGDPTDRPAHRRRGEGRYLCSGPDARGARAVQWPAAIQKKTPHAGGRRSLWCLQWKALGEPDLPDRAQRHSRQRVIT